MTGVTDCPAGKGEENGKEIEKKLKVNWNAIGKQLKGNCNPLPSGMNSNDPVIARSFDFFFIFE